MISHLIHLCPNNTIFQWPPYDSFNQMAYTTLKFTKNLFSQRQKNVSIRIQFLLYYIKDKYRKCQSTLFFSNWGLFLHHHCYHATYFCFTFFKGLRSLVQLREPILTYISLILPHRCGQRFGYSSV
jgi:hypothetical protein